MTKEKNTNPEKNLKITDSAELLRKWGYSVQENIYHADQSKVTDLKDLEKSLPEQQERARSSTAKFQTISDVELIEELQKRILQKAIKLSIYPLQEHIFIAAKDTTKKVSLPLPIEIKAKDQNV